MPLLLEKKIVPGFKIAVWENTESDDFFIKSLALDELEISSLSAYKKKRKSEILSSRHLLRILSKEVHPFRKDAYGKPYLEGSKKYISLSHSGKFTAAIIGDRLVGIDIQKRVEKISRIQHKYVSNEEKLMIQSPYEIEYLHILWGAKESLYKAYGKKEIDFIQHLKIESFRYTNNRDSQLKGKVIKKEYDEKFNILSEEIENYFLVYAYHIDKHIM